MDYREGWRERIRDIRADDVTWWWWWWWWFLSYTNTQLNAKTVLFQAIQFRMSTKFFVYLLLKVKTDLFQTIQLSISTRFFIYSDLSGQTVLFQTIKFSISTKLSCSQYYSVFIFRLIGLVGRVFANGPGDPGSILSRVIPKTLRMVLDTSLLNTQQYKVLSRVKWSNPRKE